MAFPTGPAGPPPAGALARGIVFAPTGVAPAPPPTVATGAVGPRGSGPAGFVPTGVVGPSGSGALERGIVFAPDGAGGAGAPLGAAGGGAGAAGAGGGAGAPEGGGGAVGDGGAAGAVGAVGEEAPPTGAVLGPSDGIGAVDPLGATGPESSACARRLIRTVSFLRGTVEVLTEGFFGSSSLIRIIFLKSYLPFGQGEGLVSTC